MYLNTDFSILTIVCIKKIISFFIVYFKLDFDDTYLRLKRPQLQMSIGLFHVP